MVIGRWSAVIFHLSLVTGHGSCIGPWSFAMVICHSSVGVLVKGAGLWSLVIGHSGGWSGGAGLSSEVNFQWSLVIGLWSLAFWGDGQWVMESFASGPYP